MKLAFAILSFKNVNNVRRLAASLTSAHPEAPVAVFHDDISPFPSLSSELPENVQKLAPCCELESDCYHIRLDKRSIWYFQGQQVVGRAANANKALRWFSSYSETPLGEDGLGTPKVPDALVILNDAAVLAPGAMGFPLLDKLVTQKIAPQEAPGMALLIPRETLNTVGYLDPGFGIRGAEFESYAARCLYSGAKLAWLDEGDHVKRCSPDVKGLRPDLAAVAKQISDQHIATINLAKSGLFKEFSLRPAPPANGRGNGTGIDTSKLPLTARLPGVPTS